MAALIVGLGFASAAAASCSPLPDVDRLIEADNRFAANGTAVEERSLHSFALYSYRNLAADIINGQGLYLDTVVNSFQPTCEDRAVMTAWLRQMLARADSNTVFSRRIALAKALQVDTIAKAR